MSKPTSKLPNLTVDTWDFINVIEKQDTKPIYELTAHGARLFLRTLQALNHKKIEADVVEHDISGIKTYVIRPAGCKEKLPIVLYLHGGGWVMGDEYVYDNFIRKLANCAKVAIVFPEYSLAPEAKYPTQINEVYRVLEYIRDNSFQMNLDIKRLAIMGDSAGGNLATVLAMKAKEDSAMPRIKFQGLIYPVTNADMDTDSYEDFSAGPWLSKKAMEWFWDAYVPDKEIRKDKFVSPLHAEIEDLKGMPSTLVITDENDVLRDEGEAYARKLDDAGVDIINVRINGTFHDFMMLNALSETKPVKGAMQMICGILKELL